MPLSRRAYGLTWLCLESNSDEWGHRLTAFLGADSNPVFYYVSSSSIAYHDSGTEFRELFLLHGGVGNRPGTGEASGC